MSNQRAGPMRILLFLPLALSSFALNAFSVSPESAAAYHAPDSLELIYHPVSTNKPEAQKSFDLGLTYVFAYNHDLAFKEFEKASRIDPNLAMAYWGMALALGQNINIDVTPENEKKAYEYSQKALSLLPHASAVEQAYIKALATRYTGNPSEDLVPLRFKFRDAMKQLYNDYPEDLDAACIYVESILDIDPWKYWTWDGNPREGTMEAVRILKSALEKNPLHIGANHYYIHAWEESPTPQEAIASAFRLTTVAPPTGHLLHMPCHIFMLCGYYKEAIETSKKAIAADFSYIDEYGLGGEYPLHYLPHNLKILARAYMLTENYAMAMQTADELNKFLSPHYAKMPHLLKSRIISMEINLYFERWKELLAMPSPPLSYPLTDTYWHFSRALAYINSSDYPGFQKEKALMLAAKQQIQPNEEIANNPAANVFAIAEILLDAAEAKYSKNIPEYIAKLKAAVEKQERLEYDEPPGWYFPINSELGNAFLAEKNDQQAEESFKKGLKELQRNGRLLLGLAASLKAQNRPWDAFWVEREAKGALNQ